MKSTKLTSAAFAALLLCSCGGSQKNESSEVSIFEPFDYTLTVTNIDDADSSYVYLYDYDLFIDRDSEKDALIDSTMVAESQAVFNISGSKAPVVIMRLGNAGARYLLFPQEGENSYNLSEKKGSGILAQKYVTFNDSVKAIYEAASENMPERGTPQYEAYVDSVQNLVQNLTDSTMDSNLDNAFGFYMVTNAVATNLEVVDSIVNKAPYFAETNRMKNAIAQAQNLKATSPGQQYTDFTIESNGKSVKLSDYVKPGEYTLVDFWASWCGPCKRAIAGLKENYDELHAKGLNIVGVAVWEPLADSEAWLKENPLPWDLILDAQKVPTDIYAVKGIPTLILIGPDGNIIARSHDDEEVIEAFNNAVAAK